LELSRTIARTQNSETSAKLEIEVRENRCRGKGLEDRHALAPDPNTMQMDMLELPVGYILGEIADTEHADERFPNLKGGRPSDKGHEPVNYELATRLR
jgi:hypothetical protein